MSFKVGNQVNIADAAKIKSSEVKKSDDSTTMNSIYDYYSIDNDKDTNIQMVGYSSKRIQVASLILDAIQDGDTARADKLKSEWNITEAELKQAAKEDKRGPSILDKIGDLFKGQSKSLRQSIDDADGNDVNHIFKPNQFESHEKASKR